MHRHWFSISTTCVSISPSRRLASSTSRRQQERSLTSCAPSWQHTVTSSSEPCPVRRLSLRWMTDPSCRAPMVYRPDGWKRMTLVEQRRWHAPNNAWRHGSDHHPLPGVPRSRQGLRRLRMGLDRVQAMNADPNSSLLTAHVPTAATPANTDDEQATRAAFGRPTKRDRGRGVSRRTFRLLARPWPFPQN
jgi:hypothetical protein